MLGGAPVVTAVEQVIPAHALKAVSWWRRQLTRCLRAAAKGDLSLARRLRPGDVWLEHSENSDDSRSEFSLSATGGLA